MTRPHFSVHPEVIQSDFADALGYYAEIDEHLSERLVDDLAAALRRIEAHPLVLSEYLPGWRRVLLRTFPYLLVYAADAESVRVVGMFHTHRDPALIRKTLGRRDARSAD